MTETDKELARQAWKENDWDGHVDIPKLIQLVRVDEREECAKVCEDLGMATNGMYERNHECATAIRARGNT